MCESPSVISPSSDWFYTVHVMPFDFDQDYRPPVEKKKSLEAGKPPVCVMCFMLMMFHITADQPFWGRRTHTIGAKPNPIFVKNLSVENLMHSIYETDGHIIRRHSPGYWTWNRM